MKKTEYITIRTDPNIKEYLEEVAKKQERTLSWLVNKILNEYVYKQPEFYDSNTINKKEDGSD